MKPVIGVVGNGVVGQATANAFEKRGFTVLINDVKGHQKNYKSKREIAKECSVIFVCVPTPISSAGDCDLKCVFKAVKDLAYYTKRPLTIVVKSTVPIGTVTLLEEMYPDVCFASNPEFLRQKHAQADADKPDRIVIGAKNEATQNLLKDLYDGFDCPLILTSSGNAEAIKLLSNAFLVLKVAFTNELDNVCKKLALTPEMVALGVGLDKRIGRSHLDPLLGKISRDSPCLPKDLQAFISFLKQKGVCRGLFEAAYELGVMKDDCNQKNKCKV